MSKDYEITLNDPREEGNEVFYNIVDPRNIDLFISRMKDTKEKRSMTELVECFLEGK
jgi:hypothetical protein